MKTALHSIIIMTMMTVPSAVSANSTETWLAKRSALIDSVYGSKDGALPTKSTPDSVLTDVARSTRLAGPRLEHDHALPDHEHGVLLAHHARQALEERLHVPPRPLQLRGLPDHTRRTLLPGISVPAWLQQLDAQRR
jgi:hypothetical protein